MKLFQTGSGFTIAFGFDMRNRKADPRMICWNDPSSGEWDPKATNQAGSVVLRYDVKPEFIFETTGKVVAYQPGRCIEIYYLGGPIVFGFNHITAEAA